jgi:hypothetical protein
MNSLSRSQKEEFFDRCQEINQAVQNEFKEQVSAYTPLEKTRALAKVPDLVNDCAKLLKEKITEEYQSHDYKDLISLFVSSAKHQYSLRGNLSTQIGELLQETRIRKENEI